MYCMLVRIRMGCFTHLRSEITEKNALAIRGLAEMRPACHLDMQNTVF